MESSTSLLLPMRGRWVIAQQNRWSSHFVVGTLSKTTVTVIQFGSNDRDLARPLGRWHQRIGSAEQRASRSQNSSARTRQAAQCSSPASCSRAKARDFVSAPLAAALQPWTGQFVSCHPLGAATWGVAAEGRELPTSDYGRAGNSRAGPNFSRRVSTAGDSGSQQFDHVWIQVDEHKVDKK